MFTPHDTSMERLATKLARAGHPSATLFTEAVAASPRLITLKAMGKTARLDRFIACEAWSEAAIELSSLEAPAWRIKRLCFEDGEWICTLTRFPDVPDWLDDSAECRHLNLALAILGALLAIREREPISFPPISPQRPDFGVDLTDYR